MLSIFLTKFILSSKSSVSSSFRIIKCKGPIFINFLASSLNKFFVRPKFFSWNERLYSCTIYKLYFKLINYYSLLFFCNWFSVILLNPKFFRIFSAFNKIWSAYLFEMSLSSLDNLEMMNLSQSAIWSLTSNLSSSWLSIK